MLNRSLHCIRLAVLIHNRNGFYSTNLRLQRVIIFVLLPQSNLSGEFENHSDFLTSRLFAHASAYYELGSFPDSGMKRALQKQQNFKQRRPGEDGGRKVKKKVSA